MYELIDKVQRYFSFSKNEATGILISSAVIAFIVSLRDFSPLNFSLLFLVVGASLLFHISSQKVIALSKGYSAEFGIWWNGILLSLAIAIASRGTIWWLLVPGGIVFSMIPRHRLGRFRYGLNNWQMGLIAFSGPIASIVFGTIFKNIEIYLIGSPVPLLGQIFSINLVLAVCTMLPIPPLDGHYLFFASRNWFVMLFSVVLVYTLLTVVFGIYSWIIAIIAGVIVWIVYYIKFEKEAWGGG